MNNYITIDGGTTNTRIYLACGRKVLETERIPIGVKDCSDGNERLKQALREGIRAVLARQNLQEREIQSVIASGMITSENGLLPLPHLAAPVGKKELHRGMKKQMLAELTSIPFFFIPGVKTGGNAFETVDMMRGEETELMGIVEKYGHDFLYGFPGSHSKLISVDSKNRIRSCKTTMTGEMIAAFSQHTILKNSVSVMTDQWDKSFLLAGYRGCLCEGINQALFKIRILDTLFGRDEVEIYSYFLGVILANEIEMMKKSGRQGVVLGGKRQLQIPMEILLKETSEMEVLCVPQTLADEATCLGAIGIYEEN